MRAITVIRTGRKFGHCPTLRRHTHSMNSFLPLKVGSRCAVDGKRLVITGRALNHGRRRGGARQYESSGKISHLGSSSTNGNSRSHTNSSTGAGSSGSKARGGTGEHHGKANGIQLFVRWLMMASKDSLRSFCHVPRHRGETDRRLVCVRTCIY